MANDPRDDATKRSQDPVEGAPDIIDRELRRQGDTTPNPKDKPSDKR